MEKKLIVNAAPHIHSGDSSSRIMLDVILALLPTTAVGIAMFGASAAVVVAACVISAVASEFLFNLVCGKKQTIGDLSAAVTGLLLGLNLSTNVPVWQCVVGSAFAILVVKCLFGGLGHNLANPAITARVMMLLCFSATVAGGAAPTLVEVVSSATPLEVMKKGEEAPRLLNLLLGTHGGAIGETCELALLLGFAWLLVRRIITWHAPVFFIGTVFVGSFLVTGDVALALAQILSGGLFLGAIFMATDYVTTPITTRGRIVFAVGCGILTTYIRFFGGYPEGVSISILVMNLLTPYIEKWTATVPLGGKK